MIKTFDFVRIMPLASHNSTAGLDSSVFFQVEFLKSGALYKFKWPFTRQKINSFFGGKKRRYSWNIIQLDHFSQSRARVQFYRFYFYFFRKSTFFGSKIISSRIPIPELVRYFSFYAKIHGISRRTDQRGVPRSTELSSSLAQGGSSRNFSNSEPRRFYRKSPISWWKKQKRSSSCAKK